MAVIIRTTYSAVIDIDERAYQLYNGSPDFERELLAATNGADSCEISTYSDVEITAEYSNFAAASACNSRLKAFNEKWSARAAEFDKGS